MANRERRAVSVGVMWRTHSSTQRGTTLIEALVGVALIVLVFTALVGAFRLGLELLTTTKARIGATALANEQMEYIRSLPYDSVGTAGGIPSGPIPQSATTTVNGVEYTRRTFIQYVDAPQDGLDVSDENGITADYKIAKVEMTWSIRERPYALSLLTNIVPKGVESIAGGGTLRINVFDALGGPVQGATVRVVNTTGTTSMAMRALTGPCRSLVR